MARSIPYIYADLHGAVSKQDWNNYFSHFSFNNSQVTTSVIILDTIPSSYNSAKWTVSISGSLGLRISDVYGITDGNSLEHTEVSTADIGNTSPLSLIVSLTGTSLMLSASASSGNWAIKLLRVGL